MRCTTSRSSVTGHVPSPFADGVAFLSLLLVTLLGSASVEAKSWVEGADYDPAIAAPEELIPGFGERAATPEEILHAVSTWANVSPRATLVEHGRTWQNRPLVHLIITTPENHGRLEIIRRDSERLADPRGLGSADRDRLTSELPGIAWLAASIHGNETSGADAAVALIHHLIADRSAATQAQLEHLVVIVDPLMNPDGRARFTDSIRDQRGQTATADDQSASRTGRWPWGRGNHYLFDLNRDWLFAVQPETRARIRAISQWRPLLFVDAHEMDSQDTYLFSPPRSPFTPTYPTHRAQWAEVFSRDQALAFDRQGWTYYSGEWNEGWYPGYSDAWPAFRGAVGILYEMARIGDGSIRKQSGELWAYREGVRRQLVSFLANLTTLERHRVALWRALVDDRAQVLDADGPFANRTLAVPPHSNRSRREQLLELLSLHGIEVRETTKVWKVAATDALGHRGERDLPVGTLLVPFRQPEGRLAATMLDFDPRIDQAALERERRERLRTGGTTVYDITAWNVAQLAGLPAFLLEAEPPRDAPRATPLGAASSTTIDDGWVAIAVDGRDDRAPVFAARLLELGLPIRVSSKDTVLSGSQLGRGSAVLRREDVASRVEEAQGLVAKVAAELDLAVVVARQGQGEGDLPDLGGGYFPLAARPRIAILQSMPFAPTDFGAIRHLVDTHLGVPATQLDAATLGSIDLRRYTVILVPEPWDAIDETLVARLRDWATSGGTLIAMGSAASAWSPSAMLPGALDDLEPARLAVSREWALRHDEMPSAEEVWARSVPATVALPPAAPGLDRAELGRRDAWLSRFMPQGAILAARLDPEHWLTAGLEEPFAILVDDSPVLVGNAAMEVPIRLGVETEGPAADPATWPGWAPPPPAGSLSLRIAGLLWPEAAARLASAGVVGREQVGAGQIITFPYSPAFRRASPAATRLLSNAIVAGPGLGARAVLVP